jgi:hypothetical protein
MAIRVRILMIPALAAALFGVLLVSAELYLSRPGVPSLSWPPGSSLPEWIFAIRHADFPILLVGAPLTVLLGLATLGTRVFRVSSPATWLSLTLGLALGLVLLVAAEYAAGPVRRAGFRRTGFALIPLVQAIQQYYDRTDQLPDGARLLTVGSGLPLGPVGCRAPDLQLVGPRAWEISYECPNGFLTLDRFFYRSGAPPDSRLRFERLGQWGYVRD